MSDFIISAFAASNVGKRRSNNEDNYFLNNSTVNSSLNTYASAEGAVNFVGSVCDGMGGEAAGEVASQITVETVGRFVPQIINSNAADSVIENLVMAANDAVCKEITVRKKRIGTTFTLLCESGGKIVASNIGDSRIYRYSNGALTQVSLDHTQAQRLVDSGAVSREDSMKLKEKHALTQHIGIFPYEMVIEPYTVRLDAVNGDVYILCSDGLTDMLPESDMKRILDKRLSPSQTAYELIDGALLNGGHDNVTVMVCAVSRAKAPAYPNAPFAASTRAASSPAAAGAQAPANTKPAETPEKKKGNAAPIIIAASVAALVAFAAGFFVGGKFGGAVFNKNAEPESTTAPVEESTEAPSESETLPETTLPEVTVPKATVPEVTVPEASVPEATLPEASVPAGKKPSVTAPSTTVPPRSKAIIPNIPAPSGTIPSVTPKKSK